MTTPLSSDDSPPDDSPPDHNRRRIAILAVVALGAIILAWIRPTFLLDGCDLVGYAVCHQIPERSFSLLGRPLPLCARCTGTFSGALLGFVVIFARRRTRCGDLPPISVSAVLTLFFAMWALDGTNSYLALLGTLPYLYEPHNTLRLITGMLLGITLSNLVYPVFSLTTWMKPTRERSIESFKELGVLLLLAGLLIALILTDWPPILYLAGVASTVGVLTLLLTVTTLMALVILRRENQAQRWRDLWLPALIGLTITISIIILMDLFRMYVTHKFGLPF